MGLIDKRRARETPGIPLASMSDISFLLLIFFLVTTTIDVDSGIRMTLPPKADETGAPPILERNMLRIQIDASGEVLVEDRPASAEQVRAEVQRHLRNEGRDPDYAESGRRAVVSLKTDRATKYDRFVDVLDEVWMAYFAVWDEEARLMGFSSYEAYRGGLRSEAEDEIRARIKPQISIAEPETGAGEQSLPGS